MRRLLLLALSTLVCAAAGAQSIQEYGRQCAARIAEIEPFDCRKGALLPITVDGKTPAKYYPAMSCDRPAMAPDNPFPCAPYSRVVLLRDDTVQASAYCRQKSLRSENSPYYDEIDVIVHNRVNGATCWFSAVKKGIDGSNVPPPTARGAEKFWDPPAQTVKGNCVTCHDSDPWMYSPFLGQTNEYPTDPFGYYTNAIGPFKAWQQPFAITTRGNNCTSCHRIGNMTTCNMTMLQAVGRAPIKDADKWAKTYPHSHWMPPLQSDTKAQWLVTYETAIKELEKCCANPKGPGCQIVPIEGKK
jgi:cytochrome c553